MMPFNYGERRRHGTYTWPLSSIRTRYTDPPQTHCVPNKGMQTLPTPIHTQTDNDRLRLHTRTHARDTIILTGGGPSSHSKFGVGGSTVVYHDFKKTPDARTRHQVQKNFIVVERDTPDARTRSLK